MNETNLPKSSSWPHLWILAPSLDASKRPVFEAFLSQIERTRSQHRRLKIKTNDQRNGSRSRSRPNINLNIYIYIDHSGFGRVAPTCAQSTTFHAASARWLPSTGSHTFKASKLIG